MNSTFCSHFVFFQYREESLSTSTRLGLYFNVVHNTVKIQEYYNREVYL
jgi:hypothetical protein